MLLLVIDATWNVVAKLISVAWFSIISNHKFTIVKNYLKNTHQKIRDRLSFDVLIPARWCYQAALSVFMNTLKMVTDFKNMSLQDQ